MGIHYLDGTRLKNAVVAGAQRVIQMQERLNNINVFPVADSDTGTNMALTLKSVADGAINARDKELSAMSLTLAESALMGARGNSGAILAQFFQGLADSFQGKMRVEMQHFAEAARRAVTYAREAISEPREGTILTVMHDWAKNIQESWRTANDFVELHRNALHEATRSLQDTPKKLTLLAKAGVVDAGAQGFVNMLEGVMNFLERGKVEVADGIVAVDKAKKATLEERTEDITFQFCTECFVRGKNLDRNIIKKEIEAKGNSLIVAGGATSIRIHIHTNDPEEIFALVGQHGEVVSTKKEDMWKQHKEAYGAPQSADIAIITDSSCDLPADYLIRHKIRVVPLTVAFGGETFLDQVTLTSAEFYRLLRESTVHPTTSQPSAAEFQQVYLLAAENHQQAVAILLSSALSGTFQAGANAARTIKNMEIELIDSRTLTGGLGLLVMVAVEAIAAGCSIAEVRRRVERARVHVHTYICFETLDYLVRGGRLGKAKGFFANMMRLRPIVTLTPDGKIAAVTKTLAGKANHDKALEMVKKQARGLKKLRIIIGHAAAPELARYFADHLKNYFEIPVIPILQVSPTLGAHAGPGAAAISFLGFPEGEEIW